jgi:molybdenum cofactor biosynthesis enzyme MoaA
LGRGGASGKGLRAARNLFRIFSRDVVIIQVSSIDDYQRDDCNRGQRIRVTSPGE